MEWQTTGRNVRPPPSNENPDILLTYWAIQVGNKTIRSYNRLELQGMYPFVAIVDSSLIFEWVANRADSAINKKPQQLFNAAPF